MEKGPSPETVFRGELHQKEWLGDSEASRPSPDLDRIATVDIDNYHGINLKTVLVYAVRTVPTSLLMCY